MGLLGRNYLWRGVGRVVAAVDQPWNAGKELCIIGRDDFSSLESVRKVFGIFLAADKRLLVSPAWAVA